MSATEHIEYYPAQEPRQQVDAPIYEVTVQEDRAQIQRRLKVELAAGAHKLRIPEVATSMQDVSLRARVSAGQARTSDVAVRRAVRIERAYQREQWREVEEHIDRLRHDLEDTRQDQRHSSERLTKIHAMIAQGALEIPEDTAWGMETLPQWAEAIDALMQRANTLRDEILDAHFKQEDLRAAISREIARRLTMETPNEHFTAWIELDLVVEVAGSIEIELDYVSPNAIWRPLHRATLTKEAKIQLQTLAALWQNTGEDWREAKLVFSTSRSSLGIEPPLLRDDLLTAQRRVEQQVKVEAREVEIQSAQVEGGRGGGGAPSEPTGVDLPGVDDGGDPQNLRPEHLVTVRSDGQPHFIPLGEFESDATLELVATPELSPYVFLRATLKNMSRGPLLAGPVELIRDAGTVGWTTTLFISPKEELELSFGPQEELRLQRNLRVVSDKVDEVSKWRNKRTETRHYISNLSDQPRTIKVRERVPVSEIEHVKIALIDQRTTPATKPDEHGICTWDITLDPHSKQEVMLTWELQLAPDVANLPL